MKNKNVYRKNEKGNVLFLILIAVALFAALSYAVTQSTRSGAGSTDRERSALSGASLTQGPAAIRTSLIRMILGGTDVSAMDFSPPTGFPAPGDVTEPEFVFHPAGGGAVYQLAPSDVMAGADQGTWFYNANWDVPQIGVTDTTLSNDIIAFLPGVSANVCREVNRELNFFDDITNCTSTDGIIPDLDNGLTEANIRDQMDTTYVFPTTNQEDLSNANPACTAFIGQASGCFNDVVTGEYVYYSTLLER